MRLTDKIEEAGRVLTICNACRYCEGHCAVFQAMELRLEFNADNLDYMANLCHNCGACYHNCQYAPPHQFQVNVPAAMAELRQENYGLFAWPGFMGKLFANNGLWVSLISVMVISTFFILTAINTGEDFMKIHDNSFYGVISHNNLVAIFGASGGFVALALSMSIVKFWRKMSLPNPHAMDWSGVMQGLKDALTLKYLDGGNGQGCSYPDEAPSMARRWFHHMTFWGFMLCFAATSAATLMHYGLAREAPYDFISLPKILGISGGIGLLVGPVGLLAIHFKATPNIKGKTNKGMDVTFLVLLFLTSLSGLLLMLVRDTIYVGPSLSIHLGIVMTLFLSMPYGKFVHGFYRLIALIAFAVEKNNHKALVGVRAQETVCLSSSAKARS